MGNQTAEIGKLHKGLKFVFLLWTAQDAWLQTYANIFPIPLRYSACTMCAAAGLIYATELLCKIWRGCVLQFVSPAVCDDSVEKISSARLFSQNIKTDYKSRAGTHLETTLNLLLKVFDDKKYTKCGFAWTSSPSPLFFYKCLTGAAEKIMQKQQGDTWPLINPALWHQLLGDSTKRPLGSIRFAL